MQLWVTERLPMASSMEHGKDLPSVQLLMKKNQVRPSLRAKEKVPRASQTQKFVFSLKTLGFLWLPLRLCVILYFRGGPSLTAGGWFPP